MPRFQNFHVTAEREGATLAGALRGFLPDRSWSQIKSLVEARHVQVNGNLCLEPDRRVKQGDVVKVWEHSLAKPVAAGDVRIVHYDEHLVVIHKPAGITTLRHAEERDWSARRKQKQPTLDELVPLALAKKLGLPMESPERHDPAPRRGGRRKRAAERGPRLPQIRAVHRLDRDTSGLMVFARTAAAETELIRLFSKHKIERAYIAVAHGHLQAQTIDTWLVRDRGDGLRGSSPLGEAAEGAQRAITHVRPLEHFGGYTVAECRLETGRTHQIRIHLAEIGHMLCGEKVYVQRPSGPQTPDESGAPRHALHAAELGFVHPFTGRKLRIRSPLPRDLAEWLTRLKQRSGE